MFSIRCSYLYVGKMFGLCLAKILTNLLAMFFRQMATHALSVPKCFLMTPCLRPSTTTAWSPLVFQEMLARQGLRPSLLRCTNSTSFDEWRSAWWICRGDLVTKAIISVDGNSVWISKQKIYLSGKTGGKKMPIAFKPRELSQNSN